MSYAVKEIFYTLQGEGAQAGRAAVFCRFAGCNLWTGRERDRHSAVCQFCDTDFVGTDGPGGGKFSDASALARAVTSVWESATAASLPVSDGASRVRPYVVCTGGEPLLQLDSPLIEALHQAGFEVAVETNGTQAAPPGLDWICVSPKAGTELVLRSGDELKLVFPQEGADPAAFRHLSFRHLFLQPMDGPGREERVAATLAYCLAHPEWRLSLQTHKMLGIP